MPSLTKSRFASPTVVIVLLLILAALMYLQYQWTRQLTDVAKAHVAADLRKSILAWHLDLFRSFASPSVALQLNSEPQNSQNKRAYAKRYLQWHETALHSNIISNLYVWSFYDPRHPQILRLNPETGEFVSIEWPQRFELLRNRLQRKSSVLALAIAGASSPEEFFAEHPQANKPFQGGADNDDPLGGWVFAPEVPALFHPVPHEDSNPNDNVPESRLSADWVVVEYDTDVLRKELLPELAQRYFSGQGQLEYDIEVAIGKDQSSVLYSSGQPDRMAQPDATMNLFGSKQGPFLRLSNPDLAGFDEYDYSGSQKGFDFRGAFWFPVIHIASSNADWYLVAKHRHGSLSDIFARVHRRDLAIGYGILLLLVVSMGLVLVASRRAQELAKLQVDFVAGVSHDLRTPLSVISLAADNLADGVVDGREAVSGYGVRLQGQVRQLIERVEQILAFASMDRRKSTYRIAPTDIRPVIEDAVRNTQALAKEAGVTVNTEMPDPLPMVLTDSTAMSLVLQNLITNGVKYGGSAQQIFIRTTLARAGNKRPEVQVAVEDQGIGIDREEMKQIFEPFYRSPKVVQDQIRGTGLGLTFARKTVEAVGGSISVTSNYGKGSTFVLHLPVSGPRTSEVPVETCVSA